MKKTVLFMVLALLGIGLFWVSAYSQDMEVVDNSAFENARRSPAPFTHDEHNEKADIYDCAECHHLFDDEGTKIEDESSEDQSCADCHELEDVGSQPGLVKAFHLNCKGCHLDQQKGPFVCGQCHPK